MKFGGPVDLRGTHVDDPMVMEGGRVADQQTVDADRLHVGSNLFARFVTFGGPVDFEGLRVDGSRSAEQSRAVCWIWGRGRQG